MNHNSVGDFLTVGRIVRAVLHRWFSVGLLTLLLTLAIATVLFSLPDLFQSESLLYVRLGRGTVSLDPTSTAASSTISLMDSRQSEINSVKEMLGSRIVLERAIRTVGIDRVLEFKPWWERSRDQAEVWIKAQTEALKEKVAELAGSEYKPAAKVTGGLTAEEVAQHEILEEAVKRVFTHLSIRSAKESYTVNLSCRAYSPDLARDICQAIVDEYRKVHVDAHSVQGSLEFFEAQYALSQKELSELESKLRDEKNRNELMTIPGKQDLILQEIKQLQADRLKASSEVAASQARDQELQVKIVRMPEKLNLEQTAGLGNAATDSMRNQLFELEKIEIDLESKYTDGHPLLTQVRQRLAEARKIYGQQANDRTTNREALNPVRQDLELDRFRNLSALEGWKAQLAEINGKLADAQAKAEKLNGDELRINELEREVQLARNDAANYGRKREEARLLNQLDVSNLSDVSVAQPPTFVLEHQAPKRFMILAVGFIGAVALSCCLAVWRDTHSESVARERAARAGFTGPATAHFGRVEEEYRPTVGHGNGRIRNGSVKLEHAPPVEALGKAALEEPDVAEQVEEAASSALIGKSRIR